MTWCGYGLQEKNGFNELKTNKNLETNFNAPKSSRILLNL